MSMASYWQDVQRSANLSVVAQNTTTATGDLSARTYLHIAVGIIVVAALLLVAGRIGLKNVRLG